MNLLVGVHRFYYINHFLLHFSTPAYDYAPNPDKQVCSTNAIFFLSVCFCHNLTYFSCVWKCEHFLRMYKNPEILVGSCL